MVSVVVPSFAWEFTARLKYAYPEGFGWILDHFSTNSRAPLSRRWQGKKTLLSEFTLDMVARDTRMDKETIWNWELCVYLMNWEVESELKVAVGKFLSPPRTLQVW